MKNLIKNHRDLILYLIFGICTTLVNMFTYWFCAHILNFSVIFSTIIGWILSVLFAYITNRTWVFQSKATGSKQILKEITSFFSCRLLTGILDLIIMFVFVDILGMNDMLIKIISNVVVIVLNYIASKLLIFKK